MNSYRVDLTMLEHGYVELKAANREDAIEQAHELEREGMVHWMNVEIEIDDVELLTPVDPPDRTGEF